MNSNERMEALKKVSGNIWMFLKKNLKDDKLSDSEWDIIFEDFEKLQKEHEGIDDEIVVKYASKYLQLCMDCIEDQQNKNNLNND